MEIIIRPVEESELSARQTISELDVNRTASTRGAAGKARKGTTGCRCETSRHLGIYRVALE